MPAVQVADLTVTVRATGASIIEAISLDLDRGEVLGVVGESGSGKSTLALALLAFARKGATIAGGRVVIDDEDLLTMSESRLRAARGELVAYVPQDPATALNPGLSLATQLTEGIRGPRPEALARVRPILATVGLPADAAFLKRRPRQLSGGQQQRVAIAMAVAAGPRLLVLDEPTTGLDVSTQARVLELVRELCRDRGVAAVYVSHDLAVVSEIADRVAVMYGGEVVEVGATADVVRSPVHPYTRALLGAVPSTRRRHRLVPIPGRAPAVGEADRGCVFAPRCEHAAAECRTARPLLRPVASGTRARCARAEVVLETARRRPSAAGENRAGGQGSDEALTVSRLNAGYGGRPVLFDVSLSLGRGACLAVVGESGSGKTTMARCLIGLHDEQDGELRFAGERIPASVVRRDTRVQREIQYVFQNPYGSLNPRRTVESSLSVPLHRFFGLRGVAARGRVAAALDQVELPAALSTRYPADLSGGQRQRVAIARALLCEPKVLICDEVTSALDVSVQASIVELLRSLLGGGLSMIFVTHNLAVVRSIADSVVVLSAGRVVERGPAEDVLSAPRHPYTRSLMADTPDPLTAAR